MRLAPHVVEALTLRVYNASDVFGAKPDASNSRALTPMVEPL